MFGFVPVGFGCYTDDSILTSLCFTEYLPCKNDSPTHCSSHASIRLSHCVRRHTCLHPHFAQRRGLSRSVCTCISSFLRRPLTTDRRLDGFARPVYLINGQQPGPLLEANQGDILEVTVFNNLSVENTIHWHGSCIAQTCSRYSAIY